MASTTLPSIQEMFPEHLLSKENRGSSKSPASKSSSTHKLSPCTVPAFDCSSASSSSITGRSRCSSPPQPQSCHTYPGSSLSSPPLPKSPESAVSGSKSSPTDRRTFLYEPSRSDPSFPAPASISASSKSGGYPRPGSAMEQPTRTNASSRHPPTSSHSRPHSSAFSHPHQHPDNYQHQHPHHHHYSTELVLDVHPNDLPYRSQSRSPPYASRVPYPYPPRPGSSDHHRPRHFSHQTHQAEEDELDGDDCDDGMTSTPGTGANNTSTRKHVCPTCFKRFNRPSSLKIHVNTHTGATPFRCPWPNCGREFNVNSNMRRHYRNHLTPSRNQGIFPLAPPPTSGGPPNQVPALVPATQHGPRDYPPPLSRSHHSHQVYSPPSSAPPHNPIGPNSDQSSSNQAAYRHRSHTHSLSAGSERFTVYHDQYHRSESHERGRELARLGSSPQMMADFHATHSQARQSRGGLDVYRPSSQDAYGHHGSSSSTRHTMAPSPPTTHSSVSETGHSDLDMDVDGDESRFRYTRPSRSRHSPRIRNMDHHHHSYDHSEVRRHRPPALPLDHDGMEVDPKQSANGVEVDDATRRPLSPAGSSFRSSSPSPSFSSSSTRSPSRSLSRERQVEYHRQQQQPLPKYSPSKPYTTSTLSGVQVSTTLRPAFA